MMKRFLSITLLVRKRQTLLIALLWAGLALWPALTRVAFAGQIQDKAGEHATSPTAFIYQGQLKDGDAPANGAYDFQFILYTAQAGGEEIGSIISQENKLTNGLFRVQLDFGRAASDGQESWLEIRVRASGSPEPYIILTPRQRLTPTPYAIFAQQERWSLIGVPVGFAGDRGKNTDIVSVEENKISKTEREVSLAKLVEKVATPTKTDDRSAVKKTVTLTACANPAINCSDSAPAFSATNTGSGAGIFGSGNIGPGVSGTSSFGRSIEGIATGAGIAVYGKSNQGFAGYFEITNAGNPNPVLHALTTGSGAGIDVFSTGGTGGKFVAGSASNPNPALDAETFGTGYGIHGKSDQGSAGYFEIANASNNRPALYATTSGSGASVHGVSIGGTGGKFVAGFFNPNNPNPALDAETFGTGDAVHARSAKGRAGFFEIANASNSNPSLYASTLGNGNAIVGSTSGGGIAVNGLTTSGIAGKFVISGGAAGSNPNPALEAITLGTGPAVHAKSDKGYAGLFEITNPSNVSAALFVSSIGNSPGVVIRSKGSIAGDIAQTDPNSIAPALSVITLGKGPAIQIGGAASSVVLDVLGTAQVKVLQITGGADLAERFEVSEAAKPGMVVAIDPGRPGSLCIARGAYNRRVAGVISGANKLDAGMILANLPGAKDSLPVALSGRVWVNGDATKRAIEPGDMLTTADQPGYAMKVSDKGKAQGAIIGKAMTGLKKGETGMVLILINLQ